MSQPDPLKHYLRSLGQQIRQARKARGLGTEALASQTAMAAQNIRAIESGQRNVTVATLLRLADALQLEPHALLPQEVVKPSRDDQWLGLTDRGWQVHPAISRPAGPGWLPALDASVQAGPVADVRDAKLMGWICAPEHRHLVPDGLFALRVRGDSMLPRVPDGAWGLCRTPAAPPLLGKLLVFGLQAGQQGWQLKRLVALQATPDDAVVATLASLNPDYPPVQHVVRDESELTAAAEWLEGLTP